MELTTYFQTGTFRKNLISVAPDTLSCKIRCGTNEGTISVEAVGDLDCSASGDLDLEKCSSCSGTDCQAGSAEAYLKSAEFRISLGMNSPDESAGALFIKATTPTLSMYTPSALSYPFFKSGVLVLTDSQGHIQQVKSPSALAQVTVASTNTYAIAFYHGTNISGLSNGFFVLPATASPFVIFTVENPDAANATNRLRVTENRQGAVLVSDFSYTNGQWYLAQGNGQDPPLRTETESVTSTNGIRTVIHTVTSGSSIIQVRTRRYLTQQLGQTNIGEVLIEDVLGTGAEARASSYTYYTNGLLQQAVHADGSWAYYVYDAAWRPTNVFSTWLNQGPTTNRSLCRVTEHYYTPDVVSGSGDDGTADPGTPRLTIDYVQNVEVSRRYKVVFSDHSIDLRAQVPASAWNATNNVATTTWYFLDTSGRRKVSKVAHADGTVELYSYTQTTNYMPVRTYSSVVMSGSLGINGGFEKGTIKTTVTDYQGRLLSRQTQVVDWGNPNGHSFITTSSEQYYDCDDFGRPRQVLYLDGRSTFTDYGCCGPNYFVNREGTTATYGFDALKRLVTTSVAGITTSNALDGAGRLVAIVRYGTDGTLVTNRSMVYDTAG